MILLLRKMGWLIVVLLLINVNSCPSIAHSGLMAFLEPPDGYIYHGTSPNINDVDAYIKALGDLSLRPAVEGVHLGIPGTRPQSLIKSIQQFFERVGKYGVIPHLSFSFSIGDGQPVDDIIAFTDSYDQLIRELGAVIRDFGSPVFVRLGFEFNGSWNGYTPGIYPKAFRKVVDLFKEVGAINFATIWCYEPNGLDDFDALNAQGEPLWYPGDEYVDWFGLDLFRHTDFTLHTPSRSGNQSYYRTMRFLEMARKHNKPVFLSEVAAVNVNIISEDELSGYPEGRAVWDLWFEPFFTLLIENPHIKGFIYMSQDYRGSKYESVGWGNARLQDNKYVLTQWISQLDKEGFIHAPDVAGLMEKIQLSPIISPDSESQSALDNTSSSHHELITNEMQPTLDAIKEVIPDDQEILALVDNFGENLKKVSLLAPKDEVIVSIEENYKEYVASELLLKWQTNLRTAPGRLVSSPWPDRIEILRMEWGENQQYTVYGEIIEITSADLITGFYTAKRPVTIVVQKINDNWLISSLEIGEYIED